MFLREEIKDELISRCTVNNLPIDLAKIFITQDGISSEDLFRYKYSLTDDEKFYHTLFEYVYNYVVDKVDKRNFGIITRDILSKLSCENYYLTFNSNINYIEHDYIISKLIEDIILYVHKVCDIYELLSFLNTIRTMPYIDHNILKNCLLHNKVLWDFELFKLILQDNMIDYDFIYLLFINLYDYYPEYMLEELLLDIYQHKQIFIDFLNYLLDKYSYSVDENREYVFFVKYSITSKKEKKVLSFLRNKIVSYLDAEVELEIMENVNFALANSMVEANTRSKELWNLIRKFLIGEDRKQNRITRFSKYGTEDVYDMYGDDFISDLSIQSFTLAYINDLLTLDGWSLFLRTFNINRFYFTHTRNQLRIQYRLEHLIDVYSEEVKLATNLKLYLYMYENSEQK